AGAGSSSTVRRYLAMPQSSDVARLISVAEVPERSVYEAESVAPGAARSMQMERDVATSLMLPAASQTHEYSVSVPALAGYEVIELTKPVQSVGCADVVVSS